MLVPLGHNLLFLFEDPLPQGKLKPGYARGKKKVWVCQTDIVSVQDKGIFLPLGTLYLTRYARMDLCR